jgi:hypothetical protein
MRLRIEKPPVNGNHNVIFNQYAIERNNILFIERYMSSDGINYNTKVYLRSSPYAIDIKDDCFDMFYQFMESGRINHPSSYENDVDIKERSP